ncbi:MAG: response regulator [Deltaproteobacteria bacterium]
MAKKILLADDSITIQKVIMITLASEDYELIIVGDGDSAVSKARELRPDLVLADVAMPGKNGYEVCTAIKNDAALKNIPVLLLAGTFEPLNREEAAKAGADDSIVKPFESQELIDKVRDLIKKGEIGAGAPQVQQLRPAVEKKPAPGVEDIWEAGDFLGFTEEAEVKVDIKDVGAPDLDFLEGGVFETGRPHKEDTFSPDHGFMDLEFKEEEAKPSEVPAPDFGIESFDRGFSGFGALEPEKKIEEKKPEEIKIEDKKEAVPSFDTSAFEGFKDNAFEPPPFNFDEIKSPSFESGRSDVPWAQSADRASDDQKGALAEPDIIEMPQEVEAIPEPVVEPQVVVPVAQWRIEPPARTELSSDAVERGAEAKVSEVIEKIAARVEERITQVSAALEKAEAQMNRAIDSVTGRAEEDLRAGLSSAFQKADGQVAQIVEGVAQKADAQVSRIVEGVTQRAEQRVREEISATLNRLTPPRETVEDIIRKTAREVVEKVVWEVIPEMAENLIKAEIARFKEALVKMK